MPPKLEPLPPDHQVLGLRDLKHSHTVFGISKVGQKIAISVECLLSATFEPCAASCSAVALSWRDMRLSVQLSFPHSVWALAFYAVLQPPVACCRPCMLQRWLGFGGPASSHYFWPYRYPASGFRRHSSVGKPSLDRDFCTLAQGVQISTNMCEISFQRVHCQKKRSLPIQALLVACS